MNKTDILTMEEAKDWHVVGLVVHGKPPKIPAIRTALLAIPHTEVPTFDEK
ncbi:assembly protein for periplasmic nitrate reductase [Aggregatibacter aphrophilus]|nr:assembly protein for periplasmic nitrate reductase [Aggregatibacter aphrophilus]